MSAELTAQEPSAKSLVDLQPPLVRHFDLIAQAPGGVTRLRELILTLAVQGKLVPQDPSDEPASELLQKIRAEKDRLIAEGKIKRDKPLAEITDEEKPFELPNGWEWAALGKLAKKLTDGSHNPPRDAGVGYPMLSSQNVWEHGFIDFSAPTRYVGHEDFKVENKRTNAEPGDVLLTIVASIGRAAVVPADAPLFVLQRSVAVVRADINPAYLALFLRSPVARAFYDLHGKGTAQKGIYLGKLGTLPVAVPPILEQPRIVTRVEELMQLCDALEAQGQLQAEQHARLVSTLFGSLLQSDTPEALADNWQRIATHFDLLLDRPEAVDALEQAILQLAVRGLLVPQDPTDEPASVLLQKIRTEKNHLLAQGKIKRDKPLPPITDEEKPFELPMGWEWVKLGIAAKKITDGTHHSPANFPTGDFMYLSAKNIKPWGIDLSSATFVPRAVHEEIFARCDPEFGDILYIKDGATTGILTVNTLREPFSLLSSVGVIKPSCGLTSDYMALVMQSPFFYQAMRDGMSGVAITRVTLSKLADAKFPLPPLSEQSRIVTRVNELRSLCGDLRQRLTTLQSGQKQLAQALIDNATA